MSDSVGNNKYTFTWEISNLNYEMFSSFDSNEIRSPSFITKHIGGASWYLAIRAIRTASEFRANELLCYLGRNSVDIGNDMIKIQYTVNASANRNSDESHRKEISETEIFKRGDSYLGCKFHLEEPNYSNLFPVTLQCNVIDYSSVSTPLVKCSKVETKIENFIWKPKNMYDKKTFSGFHGVRFEVGLQKNKIINYFNATINVSRCDNENVKCYLMVSSTSFQGNIEMQLGIENIRWDKPFEIGHVLKTEADLRFSERNGKKGSLIDILLVTSILKDSKRSISEGKHAVQSNNKNILSHDLLRMYENKMHTDVKLTIGNQTFLAHKGILSCRSPVFAAMFDQKNMVEAQTGVVDITDMDDVTLNLLLKYMYTNNIDKLQHESALKLLMAAEKYQMLFLRKKCASYLLANLSEQNVCEVLLAADMISDQILKSSVVNYLKSIAHKVLLSDSWKQLVRNNSDLVTETLSVISEDFGMLLSQCNAKKDQKE